MRTRLFSIILLLGLGLCLPARAADRINVTDFGADPTDEAPDTQAIISAVNSLPAHVSRSIYFPPGKYIVESPIYVPANTSCRFYGDGPGVSTIVFRNGTSAGIFGYQMESSTLQVDGLTLKAGSQDCGTAIWAIFDPAS
ncbi:MAG TPA: glycosyl hydrolase family 28-related protein, partial [Verrucomicrobiae bacterium]|nr:glycosyl hydrolase family 28-related protein [Verrucomicrobiae bacterium]